MKNLFKILFVTCIITAFGCGKDKVIEDPHNYSLLNKSPDEIRATIKGKWQVQYAINNSVAGPQKFIPQAGQGDLFRFLANDTVKQSSYNDATTGLYAKAQIKKIAYPVMELDSVFHFTFPMNDDLLMQEIKSDTLVMQWGLMMPDYGGTYYLIRKP